MRTLRFSAVLAVGVTLLCVNNVRAQADPMDEWSINALQGVDSIDVIIPDLSGDPDAIEAGLTSELIEAQIERRLLEAGVPVSDQAMPTMSPEIFILRIHLDEELVGFAYYIGLEMEDLVELSTGKVQFATVWNRPGSGGISGSSKDAIAGILNTLDAQMDRFLDDYRQAHTP